MQVIPFFLLQFLHIFFAAILMGTTLYLEFVLLPVILKRPADESKAFFEAMQKPLSVMMGVSSGITLLTGLLWGTLFGSIHSLSDLSTPYGLTYLTALAVILTMMVKGPRIGPHLLKNAWQGTKFAPNAAKIVRDAHRLPFAAVFILLTCMILMRFGL